MFSFSSKNNLVLLLLFWLAILPTTYAIAYTPLRVLTPVWFFILIILLAASSAIKIKNHFIVAGTILILFAGIIVKIYTEVPLIQKYTTAYDKRTKILLAKNSETTGPVVTIDSLPSIILPRPGGWLLKNSERYIHLPKLEEYLKQPPFDNPFVYTPYRDAEMSPEMDDWKNVQLQNALHLKFKIVTRR